MSPSEPLAERWLILGGIRSGKSAFAEQQAGRLENLGAEVVYLATADAARDGMHDRVARHRARRPAHWKLIEEPYVLNERLREIARPNRCVLVDCLTLWLSHRLFADGAERTAQAVEDDMLALESTVASLPGHLILISNEIGLGGVPMHPVSRAFADGQGLLNQRLAAVCSRVVLVAAGLPLILKHSPNSASAL